METLNKEQISNALREAMNKEDLHTRAAAKALNLNPCYISMAQNPKSFDAMGKTAWIRLEEWFETREPLTAFIIPEGEEIWKPKEKPVKEKDVTLKMDTKPTPLASKKVKDKVIKEPTYSQEFVNNLLSQLADKTDKNVAHPFEVKQPAPDQQFTDTARLKVALDIEINLVINGQKIQL